MNLLKYWTVDDFEISSHSYNLNSRKNKSYRTSGSDNSGKCLYTYNELGYRGDSIKKDGFKIMSLGCSLTEGVGVMDNQTWPSIVSQMVPNGVNLNFGTGGRSNDFISRAILTYFDLIKPDLILILYTYPNRREYFSSDGGIHPFSGAASWGYFSEEKEGKLIYENLVLSQNKFEDEVNWFKNHLIIKHFLENRKCNWVWDNSLIETTYTDENMFSGEFGRKYLDLGADGLHPGKNHHFNYAMKIFNNIIKNRPGYFPKGSENYYKKSLI